MKHTTTLEEVVEWLNAAPEGATHMIVAHDEHDISDFPVYVMPGESARKTVERIAMGGSRIHEVYKYSLDLEDQLHERKAYHL